ncbi:MAG: hypothetical protein HFJ34_04340 [Clostridia bacterium]|nr:hypothetical protein [Clostridia bacterium]
MEDLYENKILDDLYEIREGFITSYKKKYGELEETKKAEQAEDELVNFMKKFIKDENTMKELFEKINKFEGYALDEMCFWHKPYYKLGFIDGMRLKKEIREGKIIENTSNDSIILQNINEISDYFEEQKYRNLKKNKEYDKIRHKIEEIKNKYPRVREFFEDDKIEQLTKKEMKAILDITELQNDRTMYEADEMLKIGLREGKAL